MLTTFSSCGKFTKASKGKGWNILGTSPSGLAFHNMVVDSNGIIYASGPFITSISSVSVTQLGMYNPTTSTWTSIGSPINGRIWAMALDSNNNLYIGGDFTIVGTTTVNYVAMWNGSTWSALGTGANVGANAGIIALTCDSQNNVYVSGGFTKVANASINATRVAKYTVTTSTWSALGTGISAGVNITIYDICVDTNFNVYVAGYLSAYGMVAKWNGSTWATLGGTGLNSDTFCVTTDSANNVYASGAFSSANGVAVNNIAMWNGTVWAALGTTAIQANAGCLRIGPDNKLYAGAINGKFYVWDGSTWTLLNTFNNQIRAIAIDSQLNPYVTGFFTINSNHCVVKYN